MEDLAFPSYSSRESDEVGFEDICEHGTSIQAVSTIAVRYLGVVLNKRAELRRAEKNREEWREKFDWNEYYS